MGPQPNRKRLDLASTADGTWGWVYVKEGRISFNIQFFFKWTNTNPNQIARGLTWPPLPMEPEVEPRLKKGESSLKRLEKETRWRALIVCMTPSTWLQSLAAAAAAATAAVARTSCCIALKSITRWPGSLPNFNQNFPTITIVHTYVRHRYFSYIDNGAAKLMHEHSG